MSAAEVHALQQRAAALRECARRATTLSGSLAHFLHGAATTAATPDLWHGPYPTEATATLARDDRGLQTMAHDLSAAAASWLRSAGHLEHQAGEIAKADKAAADKAKTTTKTPR